MARAKLIAVNAAVLLALLFLIEGALGYAAFARNLATVPFFAEQRYTEYDPLLGWINRPSVHIPDMYGEGVFLKTNRQRFRSDRDFPPQVSDGRVRIICSGDSFTFGYGVSNDEAWCERLTTFDSRIETVNMGQGGYGIDQAYLWYERDAGALTHQIHLFVFIEDDIYRAVAPERREWQRPILTMDGGTMKVQNVPLSQPSPRLDRLWSLAGRLRTVKGLQAVQARLGLNRASRLPGPKTLDEQRAVVAALLAELKRLNDERGSTLIVVQLPTQYERGRSQWSEFIAAELRRRDLPMVHLLPDFLALPPGAADAMFIAPGEVGYALAEGHYNARGNAFVAQLIYERIRDRLAAVRR